MDYLEKIRQLKNEGYTRSDVDEIADEMEELLGHAQMWDYVRIGMSNEELIENLEFIAKEADI